MKTINLIIWLKTRISTIRLARKQNTKRTSTFVFCPVDRICVTLNDVSAALVCCTPDVTYIFAGESMFSLLTTMVGFVKLSDTSEICALWFNCSREAGNFDCLDAALALACDVCRSCQYGLAVSNTLLWSENKQELNDSWNYSFFKTLKTNSISVQVSLRFENSCQLQLSGILYQIRNTTFFTIFFVKKLLVTEIVVPIFQYVTWSKHCELVYRGWAKKTGLFF